MTIFCDGVRGNLTKVLTKTLGLDAGRQPQLYGLGIKEVWQIKPELHKPGHVIHSLGWPLNQSGTTGGGFLYHGRIAAIADAARAAGLEF